MRPKDIGVSVRARLLRLARERGEDFQLLLIRYANERLLYRLSESRHGPDFVLKGATLFTVWTGHAHRATRDLDLLAFGDPSEKRVRQIMAEILALDVEDDGVRFDADSLDVGPIREEQEYGGIRVVMTARVTTAKIRLQVDIGFGDAVTPDAVLVEVPPLLDFPAPRLRAYPRETVVAEKLETLVQLGLANSRMKDFYDLVVLSRMFEFDGELLTRAIRATFERRSTPVPRRTSRRPHGGIRGRCTKGNPMGGVPPEVRRPAARESGNDRDRDRPLPRAAPHRGRGSRVAAARLAAGRPLAVGH